MHMGCQPTSAVSNLMSVSTPYTSYIVSLVITIRSARYKLERRHPLAVFTGTNRVCACLFVDLFVASMYSSPPMPPPPPRQQTPVATVAPSVIGTSYTQVYYIVYTSVHMCNRITLH